MKKKLAGPWLRELSFLVLTVGTLQKQGTLCRYLLTQEDSTLCLMQEISNQIVFEINMFVNGGIQCTQITV
jgi:hypothetical protein